LVTLWYLQYSIIYNKVCHHHWGKKQQNLS
jgi:hypothetical protein